MVIQEEKRENKNKMCDKKALAYVAQGEGLEVVHYTTRRLPPATKRIEQCTLLLFRKRT